MTDQQTYTDPDGDKMYLYGGRVGETDMLNIFAPRSVVIPAGKLLAMIDRASPDAMRAYLRETAPEVIADLYRPEIPEADSPEDVDEHPEPVITVTPEALDAVEQLGRVMADLRDAYVRGLAR